LHVIDVQDVSKKYQLRHLQPTRAIRDALADGVRSAGQKLLQPFRRGETRLPPLEDFWAVRDLSFKIDRGERVGIIGRNGAGKSTLLKILSRITAPTKGRIVLKGRVASLLEVGTGFHPDLTGRENVYLNGAILGMTKAETRRKFDEIVAFAEVEKFLDTPVKRYSSGMYVRLAFAVAAHLEPEILIVDEVLAVGDAQFQKKCLGKMEEVGREGRTVIFVSHNIGAIHSLTEKCLVLEKGQLVYEGETRSAVERYLAMAEAAGSDTPDVSFYRRHYYHPDDGPVKIEKIWFEGVAEDGVLEMGASFAINVEVGAKSRVSGANIAFALMTAEGQCAALMFSGDRNFDVSFDPGSNVVRMEVKGLPLVPGRYYLDLGVNQSTETTAWDGVTHYPAFEVRNRGRLVQWLNRPFGVVHWDDIDWRYVR
jgi:lipopolysaccharide transport system ATP-binding protein